MSAQKSDKLTAKEAMAIGLESVNELKAHCITRDMSQSEFLSSLTVMMAYVAIELSLEIMRSHRDVKSDLGVLSVKVQMGMLMDGVVRAVESTKNVDPGPSYPYGGVKVPGA